MGKLHRFYGTKAWRDLSYALKIKAEGKCSRCKETILDFKYLIAHHKIELNKSNVDNPDISLNPELIEIVCHACHNKVHRRFGNKQNVYIIYGSPLSGKTTLARELMQYGDIVVDIDSLWQIVTFQDRYIKPNNVRFNIFKLRDELLDQVRTRYGQWYDAYVIGGYPCRHERKKIAEELGAELIYCESTKEECIERAIRGNRPKEWIDYIERWWDEYTY